MEAIQSGYPSIDKPWLKYYSKEDLEIDIPDCSIYEYLNRSSSGYGEYTALEYFGKRIKYRELFLQIEKSAKALLAFGVAAGSVVSVCLPNTPEVVCLIYAINRIGAVANMLDIRCGVQTLQKSIKDAGSEVLICLNLVTDKFIRITELTHVKTVVVVSPMESMTGLVWRFVQIKDRCLRKSFPDGFITWNKFIAQGEEFGGSTVCTLNGNAEAIIAYTGGTTGEPKGVVGTNRNINAVVEMELKVGFNQSIQDSVLTIAPPWTYYGICNSLHVPLCMGLRIVLLPKFSSDEFVDVLLKYKPNHVVAVPSLLTAFQQEKYEGKKFGFLKSLIVGADRLEESLEEEVDAFLSCHGCSIRVSKGYGMTEVMAAAAYSKLNANDIGSVGIPYPLNVISAFNERESGYEECRISEHGELAICGPTIMKSYFGGYQIHNSEVLRTHKDGKLWAHTGDIGYVGNDGRIYVVGRIKRMFTRSGYKIFPATIEQCIMKHSAVEQVAVVSVKDNLHGSITKAYVVKKKAVSIDDCTLENELSRLTGDDLYDYEIPDIYVFVESLPLVGIGKVDYRALEER